MALLCIRSRLCGATEPVPYGSLPSSTVCHPEFKYWALSKTGGKLITIEIDPSRYKEAVANFKEAGLADYIDARLADAHKLVPELAGPFDFVFSDADKEWIKNYFVAVSPKLKAGECFTTHNIESGSGLRGHRGDAGSQDYLQYLLSLPDFETTVNSAGGGVAISYKKSN